MSLAFHASPPPGEWLNDPNGLVYLDGAWRLFVQHCADAPAFRATGWARLSSRDLLDWTWDGVAIAPDGDDWAYSGSVTRDGARLVATHTVHDAATGLERQVRRTSTDDGANWSAAVTLIPAARNVRDPFVFDGGAAMLLACPGGWDEPDTASRLALWRCRDGAWHEAGRIGPWQPPGVMWEVPVMLRLADRDVLLISTVDRRGGGAVCAVRAWFGTLGPDGFERDPACGAEGQRLDLGPDFYAAMAADGAPLVVGWLSSWQTARADIWPGFAGGAIGLPRRLSLTAGRVRQHVAVAEVAFPVVVPATPVAGRGRMTFDGTADFSLTVAGPAGEVGIVGRPHAGNVSVMRSGAPLWQWQRDHAAVLTPCAVRDLTLFVDGPAIELFIEPDGAAVSLTLPRDDRPFVIDCVVGDVAHSIAWHCRAPQA